ncbi:hypothetical protein FOA52_006487 [Chlamydomonas sp. UWO 241]|nr:hypothetical protein FOA52_006487 [Chlamydomonas sp. UWO 241]
MASYLGRPAGGEFKAMPKEDLDMAKMMKKMKASGMGGTIFNKDDMLKRATDEAAVGDGMGGLGMGADPVIGMGGEGIPPMPDPDGWDAKKFAEVELKAAELAAQKQARGEEL